MIESLASSVTQRSSVNRKKVSFSVFCCDSCDFTTLWLSDFTSSHNFKYLWPSFSTFFIAFFAISFWFFPFFRGKRQHKILYQHFAHCCYRNVAKGELKWVTKKYKLETRQPLITDFSPFNLRWRKTLDLYGFKSFENQWTASDSQLAICCATLRLWIMDNQQWGMKNSRCGGGSRFWFHMLKCI